jgi:hypothetical protein
MSHIIAHLGRPGQPRRGGEVDERLTLRHLAAHVSADQYATLRAADEAALRDAVEAAVPA